MRRVYVSTADFRAPFDPVDFQGLGQVKRNWPKGRSYFDTGNFRAPYDDGYFQDGTLLGVPANLDLNTEAPPLVRRFMASGEPVPTTLRDVSIPLNQINRWVYAGMGAVALMFGYRSYKRWKKLPKEPRNGQS